MDQNKQIDLVGQEIEVFLSDDPHDIKTVKVKNQKYVGDTLIVVTEDGEIYSEEDINFTYSLTPEATIWMILMNNGIIPDDFNSFNFDTYHKIFTELMDKFVGIGILSKSNDEHNDGNECDEDELKEFEKEIQEKWFDCDDECGDDCKTDDMPVGYYDEKYCGDECAGCCEDDECDLECCDDECDDEPEDLCPDDCDDEEIGELD